MAYISEWADQPDLAIKDIPIEEIGLPKTLLIELNTLDVEYKGHSIEELIVAMAGRISELVDEVQDLSEEKSALSITNDELEDRLSKYEG